MAQKTRAAVAKWLQKQEWFDAWVENMRLQDVGNADEYILGFWDEFTLVNSFVWQMTPEGYDYWCEIEKQFKKWYYGDN